MKKLRRFMAAFLCLTAVLMSGCSKAANPEKPNSFSEASDPMTNVVGDQSSNTSNGSSGKKVIGSYGHGFKPTDVDFSTDTLVLTPTVTGDENPTTLGVMAFVDGFPQEYFLNDSEENKMLSTIETTPSTVEYNLKINPKFDAEFDTHYATMLYILNPNFRPEKGTAFGVHHSASRWCSQPINTAEKELQVKEVNAFKANSAPFSKKQIEQYKVSIDEDSGVVTVFDLYEEWKTYQITLNGNNMPELTFAAYTTGQKQSGEYRVTFYKNHELCTFNSGYNCLDLTLEGGKIIEEKVTLDDSLSSGDIVYCIAIPLFEGGLTEKSTSEMVIGSTQNNSIPDEVQTSSGGSDNSSGSNSDVSEPNMNFGGNETHTSLGESEIPSDLNSDPYEPNTASDKKVNEINSKPKFAFSNAVYFLDNRDEISLISSENGTVVKRRLMIDGLENIFAHNKYISVLSNNNGEYTAKLYDKDLTEIKSADLSQLQISRQGIVDFDFDRIVYVTEENAELYSCDWNLRNKRKLMELPCKEYPLATYFGGISLSEDFVAFTAYGNEGVVKAGFYGVCDFNGNYEIRRKDGVAAPQTNDTTAMWQDKHTDINSDVMPSGKIEIYKNGKFDSFKTEEIVESHRAFLLNSDAILTATESGNWSLRKYSDGKVVRKIGLHEEAYVGSAVEFNGDIYAYVSEYSSSAQKNVSNCLVWESD